MDDRLGTVVRAYREWFGDTARVIVDAGTRDGDDAAWLRDQLNAQLVIAVDANPIAAERTATKYPDFVVVEMALADFDGRHSFAQIVSDRKDFEGSSSLTAYGSFGETNMIEVNVSRFDTMMGWLGYDMPLDVVKVDLEGYTFEFLRGMGDWLSRVGVFHLETEKFRRHDGHHDTSEVEAFMFGHGFALVERSYEWGPHIEDQVWLNPKFLVG